MNTGKAIKMAIDKKGITQSELANLMGISRMRASQIVNARSCSVQTLVKVASVLGISHAALMRRAEKL